MTEDNDDDDDDTVFVVTVVFHALASDRLVCFWSCGQLAWLRYRLASRVALFFLQFSTLILIRAMWPVLTFHLLYLVIQ